MNRRRRAEVVVAIVQLLGRLAQNGRFDCVMHQRKLIFVISDVFLFSSPNNGGSTCSGANVRGLVCSASTCRGVSPDEYASRQCRKLRTDADTPDLQLSGKGFQYDEAPCKIWCHMRVGAKKMFHKFCDFFRKAVSSGQSAIIRMAHHAASATNTASTGNA